MRNVIKIFACSSILLTFFSCSEWDYESNKRTQHTITDSALTAAYPKLYAAVFNRDATSLLSYTLNQNLRVRQQAWRALAQTPVDSPGLFIQQVKEDGSATAWFALSMHSLQPEHLRALEKNWLNKPEQRPGISLVLGRQGDEQSRLFLWNHIGEINGSDYEREGALALSRLTERFPIDADRQSAVIEAAFSAGDGAIIRAWLYGFYREGQQLSTSKNRDLLYSRWRAYGIGRSPEVDQYIAKILAPVAFPEIIIRYDSLGTLQEQVQLSIELAQAIPDVALGESTREAIKILLRHSNPHVVQQALVNLSGRLRTDDPLLSFIDEHLVKQENTPYVVWLPALDVLVESGIDVTPFQKKKLNEISEANPYLLPMVLQVQMKYETDSAFLNRIDGVIREGRRLEGLYAINALNSFWAEQDDKEQVKALVRGLLFGALALGDRSISYASQNLLQDTDLITGDDFKKINESLKRFRLPGDIEVYQAYGTLYKQRFEQQGKPVIDSLASLGYPPLNRSLQQAGWDVKVSDDFSTEFRTPDWNRLWELGAHPVWILETDKGTIKVQMNTLSAPATVAAIDSLTRSGAYDGIAFHRVVPNFVIQGGDVERGDGFGGPDFTIPTEASELGYDRGAAGIASAGPDTEGSQYFFMHQWKPHLNGRYTLFGHVIEGMNTVDRIVVGDKVKRAYWE